MSYPQNLSNNYRSVVKRVCSWACSKVEKSTQIKFPYHVQYHPFFTVLLLCLQWNGRHFFHLKIIFYILTPNIPSFYPFYLVNIFFLVNSRQTLISLPSLPLSLPFNKKQYRLFFAFHCLLISYKQKVGLKNLSGTWLCSFVYNFYFSKHLPMD